MKSSPQNLLSLRTIANAILLFGLVAITSAPGVAQDGENAPDSKKSKVTTNSASPIEVGASESNRYGLFENASDIGAVLNPGSVRFDSQKKIYELSGSGKNMWATQDEFYMVWKKVKGDFRLSTEAKLLGQGVDPHRKLGWMIRSGLDTDSPYADATVHGDGSAALQYRVTKGAETLQVKSQAKSPETIQLSRVGNKISMVLGNASEKDSQFVELNLGDEVYVGLFVCSHNAQIVEKAIFSNVRVSP
jgi:TolB protein